MKSAFCLGIVLSAAAVFAQAPGGGQRVTAAARLQQQYNTAKTNLTQSAEKMTDETATFRPSPDLRTFAGVFAHVAQFHYIWCAQFKGGTNPNQENLEQTKTSRADAVKTLADSFAYCDDAFSSLTEETLNQFVAGRGGEQSKVVPLMNLIAHDNEEYGIATIYLRMKGLVPPSTENAARGRGAPAGGGRGERGR